MEILNYDPADPDKMKLPAGKTCGDYEPTKKGVTYTIKVSEEKFFIEIVNREKSYVATSMMRPMDLSKVWGSAA